MKIIEAINQIDTLLPNEYSMTQKVLWLSKVESMVKRLIIDMHMGGELVTFEEFTEETDPNTELFMRSPFDCTYLLWLQAQIHYANEDFGLYNSFIMMFNVAFLEYKNYYRRFNRPKNSRQLFTDFVLKRG